MLRVERLCKKMQEENLDSFLAISPYNPRYLANFTGITRLAVIILEEAFFIVDFRYIEQTAVQAQESETIKNTGPISDEVANLVRKEEPHSLAFEGTVVSFLEYPVLEEIIDAELAPVPQMIEELREMKDEKEIATIEKACHTADMAYDHILKVIRPGMTEIEIANQLDFYMCSLGISGVPFDTIVASESHSAMLHGVASKEIIEQGDLIILDFSCYYERYVSDMARAFAIDDPGEKLKEIYQIVLGAQLTVIDAAKPGMTGVQLDTVVRDCISKHGYGGTLEHSTRHGIGLEIYKRPDVSSHTEKRLVPGNVITDEPGIYLPGIGGVCIEDDLLIIEDGNRVLTRSPRELITSQFHRQKK